MSDTIGRGILSPIFDDGEPLPAMSDDKAMAYAVACFPELLNNPEAIAFYGAIPPDKLGYLYVPENETLH